MNQPLKLLNSAMLPSDIKFKRLAINEARSPQIILIEWASVSQKVFNSLFSLLSHSEKMRAKEITHIKRKNEYIAARGLTRITLSWFYDTHYSQRSSLKEQKDHVAPNQWDIQENKFGKPEITNKNIRNLHFNISHSNDYLVIAMSDEGKIGIDIEPIGKELAHPFPSQLFSDNEQSRLQSLTTKQQTAYFTKLWTAKEAIAKCIGQGTHLDFSKIEIERPNKPQNAPLNEINDLKINHFTVNKDSLVSIAFQ